MKVALIGDTIFSKRCLEALLSNDFKVLAVLQTHPKQASAISDYYGLAGICKSSNIQYHNFLYVNSMEVADYLRGLDLDAILVLGHTGYLKENILKIPKIGCIGSYMGMLPEYPGLSPVPWTILKSLPKTAVTLYKMSANSYTGNVLLRQEVDVSPNEYVTTLYSKICDAAEALMPQLKLELQLGLPKQKIARPEDVLEYWRWLSKADSDINFTLPCQDIVKMIRAHSHPYHGAWFTQEETQIIAWKAFEGKFKTAKAPGSLVYEDDNHFVVTTKTNDLVITSFDKAEETATTSN